MMISNLLVLLFFVLVYWLLRGDVVMKPVINILIGTNIWWALIPYFEQPLINTVMQWSDRAGPLIIFILVWNAYIAFIYIIFRLLEPVHVRFRRLFE